MGVEEVPPKKRDGKETEGYNISRCHGMAQEGKKKREGAPIHKGGLKNCALKRRRCKTSVFYKK